MVQMVPPSEFLNNSTVLTFGGSTVGVFAVSVAIRKVFKINHAAVPFAISLLLAFGLAASQSTLHTFSAWVVAIVNGCVLFCAAVGANETVTDFATERPTGKGEQYGKAAMPAITSFFRATS
jgi:hypothetical protein